MSSPQCFICAKAQGLERLRGGQHADAAAAFADGADLCGRAKEQLGQAGGEALEAHAASVRTVRTACLLNEALCRLKLEEWSAAEHACTSVIEEEKTASTKALYRRGTARLRLCNFGAVRMQKSTLPCVLLQLFLA